MTCGGPHSAGHISDWVLKLADSKHSSRWADPRMQSLRLFSRLRLYFSHFRRHAAARASKLTWTEARGLNGSFTAVVQQPPLNAHPLRLWLLLPQPPGSALLRRLCLPVTTMMTTFSITSLTEHSSRSMLRVSFACFSTNFHLFASDPPTPTPAPLASSSPFSASGANRVACLHDALFLTWLWLLLFLFLQLRILPCLS